MRCTAAPTAGILATAPPSPSSLPYSPLKMKVNVKGEEGLREEEFFTRANQPGLVNMTKFKKIACAADKDLEAGTVCRWGWDACGLLLGWDMLQTIR